MALPIGATPVLRGREAAAFIAKVHKEAKEPVSLIPTPKLEQASKLIREVCKDVKENYK